MFDLRRRMGHWQGWFALPIFAYMYLPIAVLAVSSFNASPYSVRWEGFTLAWYTRFLSSPRLLAALGNSLTVAIVAVAISAVLGTLTAVGLARYYFPGRQIYVGATYLPLIAPDIALAVATWTFFVALQIPLSLGTTIAAHVVFCLAYVAVVVSSRLAGLDPRLEEAALDLGATPVQAFFKVLLPQLAPGILSGCLLAFVLSMDDFLIARFTAGQGVMTLPMAIFDAVKRPDTTAELKALSVLLIAASAAIALLAEFVRHWGSDRQS